MPELYYLGYKGTGPGRRICRGRQGVGEAEDVDEIVVGEGGEGEQ